MLELDSADVSSLAAGAAGVPKEKGFAGELPPNWNGVELSLLADPNWKKPKKTSIQNNFVIC